jgi:tetratricopeptide (TPR) repeat protein
VTNLLGREIGPYRVESELGCGGMGRVYRATVIGPATGLPEAAQVALKMIHPHLLASPGYFKRFMQEADVGRRVRHTNVVRTLDVDARQVDGEIVHYLVMEFVHGKSLRQVARELGVVPEAMLREIARQAADGLAAIHALRIVHRDIKPENILITDDYDVRIMDLGVAKVLEATISIARAGQFAGSMLYGAPEQFDDLPIGPAADLYSLGVTLYELATGEYPFRRDSQAAVIDAHLRTTPPPAIERNPQLSRFFSELIAKLVAKRAEDRFASARALQLALEEGERSEWWAATESFLESEEPVLPRIPVRRETELHGRQDVLDRLRSRWDAARHGRGAIILLEGEAGIGKTRVLDEFVRGFTQADAHVLYGSYPPSGGLGGISEAILGKFGEASLAESVAPYLKVTPSLIPGFGSLVTQSGSPAEDEPITWGAFTTACVHLLRSLSEERPLLWMIDDLHFAPQESRDLVLALARAVAGKRALIIITSRPGLPEQELAHLGRLEHFDRIPLRRLGAREVVELLRSALRSESIANRLGGVIAYKSDGVPFFVFEMIRALEQGQLLQRREDGSYVQSQVIDEIEVPSAVMDLIQGRLRDLDKVQREILDVGSVQGLRFDPALVAEVLGHKHVHVLQHLAQIERQTGLIRGVEGGLEFDQHQIQEVLYGTLLPALRAEYHTLLARAYASRLHGEPRSPDHAFLASHLMRGSDAALGLPHLQPALAHLARNHRNESLVDLADRALKLDLDAATRVDVLLRKAEHLGRLGRRELQRDALLEAAARAEDDHQHARARIALAGELVDTSDLNGAVEVAQGVLAVEKDAMLRGQAEGVLGRALLNLGRFADARPHLERQYEAARGEPKREAAACGDLGMLEKSVGNYAEARSRFKRQMEIAKQIGSRSTESAASGNLGVICKVVGNFHEAGAYLERHRELAREIGDRMGESSATGNLGLVLKNLGCPEEARSLFQESLEISREIGNRLGEARASGHLGLVAKAAGRYDEARSCFEAARVLSEEVGDVHGRIIAAGNLGNVDFDLGRFESAREHFGAWRDAAREIGDRQGEVIALGNLGNALHALGELPEARDRFAQSLELACEIGDREGEAIALSDLGVLACERGETEGAKELLDRSLSIARELGLPRTEAYVLQGLGTVAAQEGDVGTARTRLDAARDLYQAIHHAAGRAEAELELGKLEPDSERGRNKLRDALEHGRELDLPSVFVLAACCLGTDDASSLLEEYAERMSVRARDEARAFLD